MCCVSPDWFFTNVLHPATLQGIFRGLNFLSFSMFVTEREIATRYRCFLAEQDIRCFGKTAVGKTEERESGRTPVGIAVKFPSETAAFFPGFTGHNRCPQCPDFFFFKVPPSLLFFHPDVPVASFISSSTVSEMPGLKTRGKNKTVRPGLKPGVGKNKRRNAQQMEEAREKEETLTTKATLDRVNGVNRVAAIEDKQRREDVTYTKTANHPLDRPVKSRAPATEAEDAGKPYSA